MPSARCSVDGRPWTCHGGRVLWGSRVGLARTSHGGAHGGREAREKKTAAAPGGQLGGGQQATGALAVTGAASPVQRGQSERSRLFWAV